MELTSTIFDYELPLPNKRLAQQEQRLLGFETKYQRIRKQLQLLLQVEEISIWSRKHYGNVPIALCELIAEQYPLVIFHGDVGTGKTAVAECLANRLVTDSNVEDSILFKLSNSVRGSGKVGEMGSLLARAFNKVIESAGKSRRAIMIIDEGDSIAASRTQDHSHHEDKVAVNTLIQNIDGLKPFQGRVVVILCTNRLSIVDVALLRRAAIVEKFSRPTDEERRQLLEMDLSGLNLHPEQIEELVRLTGNRSDGPSWTYSDLRSRLYPAALSRAYPDRSLVFEDIQICANSLRATPIMDDK